MVLVDLDGDASQKVASFLPEKAIGVGADVGVEEDAHPYTSVALSEFGSLDMIHLNAGYRGQLITFTDADIPDFDRVMAVNVRGVYLDKRAPPFRSCDVKAGRLQRRHATLRTSSPKASCISLAGPVP